MHKVFVYGTLKLGGSNNRLLRDATFMYPAVTQQAYLMKDNGSWPFVIQRNKDTAPVRGEVYEVTDEILDDLDILEGHPGLFVRKQVAVEVDNTGVYDTVWMYFGGEYLADAPHVPNATIQEGAYEWQRK